MKKFLAIMFMPILSILGMWASRDSIDDPISTIIYVLSALMMLAWIFSVIILIHTPKQNQNG